MKYISIFLLLISISTFSYASEEKIDYNNKYNRLIFKYINIDSIFMLLENDKYNEAYWAADLLNNMDGGVSTSFLYLQSHAAVHLNICVQSIYETIWRPLPERNMANVEHGNSIRLLIKMDDQDCKNLNTFIPNNKLNNLITIIEKSNNGILIDLENFEQELFRIFKQGEYIKYDSNTKYNRLYDDSGMNIYQ